MGAAELTHLMLEKLLRGAGRVLIPLHLSPDGDSIGSALAMAHACRVLGVRATVASADPPPATYRFLAGWESIASPAEIEGNVDLLLLLDCSSLSRIGRVRDIVDQASPRIVTIDHHRAGGGAGDYAWIDPEAAATAEMIFDWMIARDISITAEVANALFTGIATDTGFFVYPNTSAGTLERAADLMKLGASPNQIHKRVHEDRPLAELRALGRALENLKMDSGGRIAWTALSARDLCESGAEPDDTEGIVNHLRSIAGTEMALIFVQASGGQVKISFRSRESVDVSELAREFGGGGHARAAGAKVSGGLDRVCRDVLDQGRRLLGGPGDDTRCLD